MENIKSCELCRKQIIKIEDFKNLHCDEKQNLKILKDLDITVSKDAKICSNCVTISHLIYSFKMSCLTNNDHLKTLIHPGINDRLILEEVIVRETKSEVKNEEKVCRFCLNFSEVNLLMEVNLEQDVVLKDMLRRCLPEIDMNKVQNPLICSTCSELLEELFNFFSQCEETEVLRNLDTNTDVLVNENMPTVANNDYNIDNSFVKEENSEVIENPELTIKSENFNIDEDIKDSINDSNPVEEKDVKPKPHGTNKEKKFVCDICSYQTNRNDHLKQHSLVHEEPSKVNIFKCDYCPFASKWKKNLISHAIRHKNPWELPKFKCNDCPYETNIRRYLVKHVQLHKPLEVTGFKCDYCPFATANKHSLIEHAICHKNPSELPKFKCNDCPYETNNKRYLIDHGLVHKDPAQVSMYKCDVCSFQTKYQGSFRVHRKQHQVEFYTCDKCNYKSKFKRSFMSHLRYHKESEQPAKSNQTLKNIKQYQCNKCWYVAMNSTHIKLHQMTHKDPSEREKYNCTECSFQALHKSTLKRHCKKNHSDLEIPFGELKTFEELQEPDNRKDNEGT